MGDGEESIGVGAAGWQENSIFAYNRCMEARKRNRLAGYDYSQYGWYFVTVCTKGMQEWFGEVRNGEMVMDECGNAVAQQWQWLAVQYEYVELDEFVVMPNHFHGIIIIHNSNVGTGRDLSLQVKVKPLSALIGAFKTTSSKLIHSLGYHDFAWQRSFYDHIIRGDEALEKIRVYIRNNPLNWDLEKGKPDNYLPL